MLALITMEREEQKLHNDEIFIDAFTLRQIMQHVFQ